MKTTVKAYMSCAVIVEPGQEALCLTTIRPGKHVEDKHTVFLSEDAAEVLIFALEMALEARRTKRAGQAASVSHECATGMGARRCLGCEADAAAAGFTPAERAELVAL